MRSRVQVGCGGRMELGCEDSKGAWLEWGIKGVRRWVRVCVLEFGVCGVGVGFRGCKGWGFRMWGPGGVAPWLAREPPKTGLEASI